MFNMVYSEKSKRYNGRKARIAIALLAAVCLSSSGCIADLAHNSDLSRMPAPSAKDYARAERYAKEAAFLMKANKQGGASLNER